MPTINVTQEIIDQCTQAYAAATEQGVAFKLSTCCPIAVAGQQLFGKDFHWALASGWISDGAGYTTVLTDEPKALAFETAFDMHVPVEPMTLNVQLRYGYKA